MGHVTDLWRHPIKGVGREQVTSVSLEAGKTMPWDRHWAVAHEDAKIDAESPAWARCMNFARAARGYRLMAVSSKLDEVAGTVTLHHPDMETITVNPDTDADARTLVNWVTQISNPDRSLPAQIYKAPDRGMTDSSTASLSIHTRASLDALSKAAGTDLDQRRFRGNIWLDGFDAWEEFTWIGRRIRIGKAEFEITKPVERCMATTVNPDTGQSDCATLDVLQSNLGHKNFGVFGVVTKAGIISLGDPMEVL
jgi:MOSC domain-containing protein